uniref:Inhibitor of Bruton agammaglobulinemia tyrosine kinase n=1 Tax=Oryzias latipes TaxID=8090 RepID=A0A3P9JX64_ORYLA
MSLAPADCTPKCRSQQHADQVIAALTGGSERQLKAFLTLYCHNATTLRDAFGRTALHLAASLGKKAVLEWLLESKGADLMVKDKESGWTALHRSAFYGQIHCLPPLIKHGGLLSTQDKEGFSVLDLTMKDRPAHVVFKNTDPTEVYTWGNNTNFSLGHGNQESRQHPELVDVFARSGVYIKQVVLCKFHSVFLSQKGQVFTCGHGQGGRLGHGDEQTYLVPRMVEGLMSHHCSQVAAAKDHTVVLTEEGYVYTFGLNTFHQLGLTPPPASAHVPKQVFAKMLKGRMVTGVAAGRFHTVLWTREAVYTMGLNGGQLGYLLDPNGEKCVTTPRQVSALHHKEVGIAMAAASDGATVVVTQRGDVYLLADYQCKKMASKQINIKKVLVSGGSLDHRVAPQVLKEGGAEKVSILALNEAGRVFCWRSSGSSVRQCRWAYPRQVFMSDIALSKTGMMFVTPDGEGFSGMWAGEHKKYGEKKEVTVDVCGHSDSGSPYERIRLEKLPFVHRAVAITMDSKGRNFGVLQADPKTSLFEVPSISPSTFSQHFQSLLEEADETDNIHDVTLQAGNRTFSAHKYILSMRSDFFRKLFMTDHRGNEEELDKEVRRSEDAVGCDLLILEKIPADMLEYALRFMYTDSCELLVGTKCCDNHDSEQERLISSLQVLGLRDRSALEVYRSLSPSTKEDNNKAKNKGLKVGKKAKGGKGDKTGANEGGANPVKSLQAVAKKLGLGSLSARLDGVRYENGRISVVQKKSSSKPKFYQKKGSYLCDVTLKSEDGKEFPCHKSVLCARLGRIHKKATSCSALEMPTTSEILQVILEYIYTDESPTIKECQNVEFVCNVLVVADQLLITRLKEMCEVVITENLTLKNAAELLEFATMYNAEQLKLSCLQFIALNMAIPAMQKRVITPYPDAPDLRLYEEEDLDSAFGTKPETELDLSCREILLKKAKIKAKKKPRRRSDSSGGYTLSDILHSPPAAVVSPLLVKSAKDNSTESLQELLTSDSDGSCMGAGSPRDMQSPVFDIRTEVIFTFDLFSVLTPTTVLGYYFKISSKYVTSCIVKSTHRPVLDLRTIMHMEANSLPTQIKQTPDVSKPSPVSSKLSQKQRKMLAMVSKEAGGESAAPTEHKHAPLLFHRARAVQSPPSSCSFRALLEEEESNSVRAEEMRSQRAQSALGSPVSATPASKRVTFKCAENNEPERPTGPWVLGAAGSPPLSSPVTFASIVEEEKQQEAALIRSREKPLALIQIEERAIQDLLLHYQAHDNPDELIVVERSSAGPMAAPTWHKH